MRLRTHRSSRKPKRGKKNLFGLHLIDGASKSWRSIIVRDQLTLESFTRIIRIIFPVTQDVDLRFEHMNDPTSLSVRLRLGEVPLAIGDWFYCTDVQGDLRIQVRLESFRAQEDDEPRLAYCVGSSGDAGLTAAVLNELFRVVDDC